ncbi:MAG TPA: hypothetical protein VIK01_28405 [Polyangiaceae bacterium]
MPSVKFTLALASLGALVAFASCTLITDVDRSKIPNPDGGLSGDAGQAGASTSNGGKGGGGSAGGPDQGAGAPGGGAAGAADEAGMGGTVSIGAGGSPAEAGSAGTPSTP